MFEVSFPELVILGVIALVVLGPERLAKAARFVGLWVRKARAQWFAIKNELEQELADEDLKRSLRETRQALQELDADPSLRQQAAPATTPVAPSTPPAAPASEPRND